MDFVIFALQKVFSRNYERATVRMLSVHSKGIGVCGIFPKEIAEMKAMEMNNLAKDHEHPLLTEIEPLTD
jgi:ATP-dependent Clp protease adaptor protein ClpS